MSSITRQKADLRGEIFGLMESHLDALDIEQLKELAQGLTFNIMCRMTRIKLIAWRDKLATVVEGES